MKESLVMFALSLTLALLTTLVMAYPVMWIWNHWLVPAINTLEYIGITQAWGILILSRILLLPPKITVDKK
jgi:ABC-type antimicrobial peptide transport system permease subunit